MLVSSSTALYLIALGMGSLSELGAHRFNKPSRPMSFKDPPVIACLAALGQWVGVCRLVWLFTVPESAGHLNSGLHARP